MKLIFNDASEITIQQAMESVGYLKIKLIGQTRQAILDMFQDQTKTAVLKVKENRETQTYERYTNYVSLTEYPGVIYEVCLAQEGRSTDEVIRSLMDQVTNVQMALCEVYELISEG